MAVEYGGSGTVGGKWPLRPDLLAQIAAEAQPQEKAPGIASADDTFASGLSSLA